MRILIWHGYLLAGTGSNVYTRALARTWSSMGHEVVVLCQDPNPNRYDLAGATVVRPALNGPLPVFVEDRYQGLRARLLPDMDPTDVLDFVEMNAEAVRALGPADLLLTNHVLLGGPVGAASGLPFVVKAHGSELEYAMRGNPALCRWGTESLRSATAVIAGSDHIATVLDELVGPASGQVRVVPPGVDIRQMHPQARREALATLLEECRADSPNPAEGHDERQPDDGNARRFADFFAGDRPTILYVGKLSHEKGVHLLLEAMADLDTRAVIAGFGPARATLEASAGPNVLFTGPLEHRHLCHLWPLAHVSVTPSIFPEAFGMVAAEAAACGSPPLVARHSGLAEIADGIRAEYPARFADLVAFEPGNVADLRRKLLALLALPPPDWRLLSAAARRTAERRWSWESVANRILHIARPDVVCGVDGSPG